MKALIFLVALSSISFSAQADIVKMITVNKATCSGKAATDIGNFNFVKLDINKSGLSLITFSATESGLQPITIQLNPELRASAGTEGTPAATLISLSEGMEVSLQDTKEKQELLSAITQPGVTSDVNIGGIMSLRKINEKVFAEGTYFKIQCQVNLTADCLDPLQQSLFDNINAAITKAKIEKPGCENGRGAAACISPREQGILDSINGQLRMCEGK